jgi:hypothetical protein
VSERVARSRELVARGFAAAAVARVMQITRQALYRTPTPRRPPQRRPVSDAVEAAIVAEALANQTDGYRMVCAFVRRRLGVPVNRKRVLRVMRERKLIQRRRPLERRKRVRPSAIATCIRLHWPYECHIPGPLELGDTSSLRGTKEGLCATTVSGRTRSSPDPPQQRAAQP